MHRPIALVLTALFLFSFAAAQSTEYPLLAIYEDTVTLERLDDYEGALEELARVLNTPGFYGNYEVISMSELRYQSFWRADSLADLEARHEELAEALGKLSSDRLQQILGAHDATLVRQDATIWRHEPSLSYTGGTEASTGDFVHQTWLHLRRDRQPEARRTLEALAAHYAAVGAPMSYQVYTLEIGEGMPLTLLVSRAPSPAAYEALVEANAALLGERGHQLIGSLTRTLRAYDERRGWARPELSVDRPAKPKP